MDDLYREELLKIATGIRTTMALADADILIGNNNPSCGDRITIDVKLSPNRASITDIAFSGDGCVISQAATSMLMDAVVGKSVDAVQRLDRQVVLDLLGIPLTPTRVKCAMLGLKVLQAGVYRYLAGHAGWVRRKAGGLINDIEAWHVALSDQRADRAALLRSDGDGRTGRGVPIRATVLLPGCATRRGHADGVAAERRQPAVRNDQLLARTSDQLAGRPAGARRRSDRRAIRRSADHRRRSAAAAGHVRRLPGVRGRDDAVLYTQNRARTC